MKTKQTKQIVAGVLVSLGVAIAVAHAGTNGAPITKSVGTTASTGSQQAAFGVESIKLGGVFGHRIETMIKGNLLKIDMEESFLAYYRKKDGSSTYRGLGLTLDGVVRLCAYSRNPELLRLKDYWIDELISTQEPDGYIGLMPPQPKRYGPESTYSLHEMGDILLAFSSDYQVFARKKVLEAARKLADNLITHWDKDPPPFNYVYDQERALILLSEVSGDTKYLKWVNEKFMQGGNMSPDWTRRIGGSPLKPLNMESCHVYRWCDIHIAMLELNRHYPHPALRAGGPQMIAWLKDGGALAPGSFALSERWRRSQTPRSVVGPDPEFAFDQRGHRPYVGESCAKCYVMQLLDCLMRERPEACFGDVMERAYYNGVFGSQTPDGRSLAYDLSVEGTRIRNPADHYCCPGSLRRAFAYLPGYVYHQAGDRIYFNLYSESDARLRTPGDERIRLVQSTVYPASGKIRVSVEVSKPLVQELLFRVPAWCRNPEIRLNGKGLSGVQSGSFFPLRREWRTGDVVELDFPMEWRWMRGIREQEGRAVLARGPVVYSLNPVDSGITEYKDMQIPAKWGVNSAAKSVPPGFEEHLKAFPVLENLTVDPKSVVEEAADKGGIAFGSKVTVKGWMGRPQGQPGRTFVLREFANPAGRKIYLRLSDDSVCVDDELFGTAIHEKTIYPARWTAIKGSLDMNKLGQIPQEGLKNALLVAPMRGSHEFEVAKGELAGRPAWMSCSLANTGQRRMEFRVLDPKFADGATPEVTLSVLYLDKEDCKVSLIYDSGDDVVRVRGREPGAYKPGGEFQIGNTGTIKRHDFSLPDARFAGNLRIEGTDFRLVADKDVDFVILGAWLQPTKK